MDRYFKLILVRMVIVVFIFVAIALVFDKFIAIGICIGGAFSLLQFVFFKKNLTGSINKNKLPKQRGLNYFIKLIVAILLAVGIAGFNKAMAIGFLIGLPAMQLGIISTAFNKKVLEDFMSDKSK